jgi:hypothetical protein
LSTIIGKRGIASTSASRLSDNHLRSIALAGTIAVPSPFPALGRINVSTHGLTKDEVDSLLEDPTSFEAARFFQKVLVEIVHEVNPRLTITRVVKLCDIAAAFLPADTSQVSLSHGQWHLSAELEALVLERLSEWNTPDVPMLVPLLLESVVYLPETAKVLLRVETGMTAAESIEYYPPTPGDRSDAFRRVFCDG